MTEPKRVINAAGKLTALGGSAQSEAVAQMQATWARRHVDLAELRHHAGERLAALTGAEAGCVTAGAAAGVTIAVAATITGTSLYRVQQLPLTDAPHQVALQAGHAVNFGAPVTQLIRLAGAAPLIVGSANLVSEALLASVLAAEAVTALLYVQSHHSVQENMVSLGDCIDLCRPQGIPVIVDAAAEEDLERYIGAGADLVTYSGGKAFGGPTSGFIVGRADLIEACELQFQGIARPMKVGKEAIAGLLAALDEYVTVSAEARARVLAARNERLVDALADVENIEISLKPDEAGRDFSRVAIGTPDPRDLVRFLAAGEPAIRTRNHHLDQGICLIDPRELQDADIDVIAERLKAFARSR